MNQRVQRAEALQALGLRLAGVSSKRLTPLGDPQSGPYLTQSLLPGSPWMREDKDTHSVWKCSNGKRSTYCVQGSALGILFSLLSHTVGGSHNPLVQRRLRDLRSFAPSHTGDRLESQQIQPCAGSFALLSRGKGVGGWVGW